jgi:transcriptional regulator with XRE-family HTH domain
MNHRLLDRTLYMLKRCDLSQPEIAKRAGVGLEWLKKLSQGRFNDPGVKLIQKLHDFLELYSQAKKNGGIATDERAPAA